MAICVYTFRNKRCTTQTEEGREASRPSPSLPKCAHASRNLEICGFFLCIYTNPHTHTQHTTTGTFPPTAASTRQDPCQECRKILARARRKLPSPLPPLLPPLLHPPPAIISISSNKAPSHPPPPPAAAARRLAELLTYNPPLPRPPITKAPPAARRRTPLPSPPPP